MIKIILNDSTHFEALKEKVYNFFRDFGYLENDTSYDSEIQEVKLAWGGTIDRLLFNDVDFDIDTGGNRDHIIYIVTQLITDLYNYNIGIIVEIELEEIDTKKTYIFEELNKEGRKEKNKSGENISFYCVYHEDKIQVLKGVKEVKEELEVSLKYYKLKEILENYYKRVKTSFYNNEIIGLFTTIVSLGLALYSDIPIGIKIILSIILVVLSLYFTYQVVISLSYKGECESSPEKEAERIIELSKKNKL